MKHDRRQDILMAAMELFAKKGFRGATTRDLAAQADVNEAIIFRYFNNKEALYNAILENKAEEIRSVRHEILEQLASGTDDSKFFEAEGRAFLERHERDSSFMRLLLFSALEGHELSDMFMKSMLENNPYAAYIERRTQEGAFRPMNPKIAARAFFGMFATYVLWQEIFGLKNGEPHEREDVIRTFVSIFLSGISKE
jgi:AcrR family transcriptional regulator